MDIEKKIKRIYQYKNGAENGTQFMDACDTAIEALLELQKLVKQNCNLQNVSNRRELLIDFSKKVLFGEGWKPELPFENMVDEYLKGN